MKIEQVKKLTTPLDRFMYWIYERHQVYLRRKVGKTAPWTDDEILQRCFFTNPYRENDKTTVWFRENIREPLRNDPRVLIATVIFRWFNYIPTGELLWNYGRDVDGCMDLLTGWNPKLVLEELGRVRERGEQVFTGAYMINSPGGEPKLEAIVRRINNVWEDRHALVRGLCSEQLTLEQAHNCLTQYDGMGGFMAYEVVTDLRHTYLLENAPDIMTWCNPGPGCIRGLYRLSGEEWKSKGNNSTSPPRPKDWLDRMKNLLEICNRRVVRMPKFEMREVEHSLCEWDKYERLLWADGRSKRMFRGGV